MQTSNTASLTLDKTYINSADRFEKRSWILYLCCLLMPIAGHTLRKIVPGNSVFLEGVSIIPIFFIGLVSLNRKRRLPLWILYPLLIWVVLQIIYAVVGLVQNPIVSLSASAIRIVPIMMTPIAYKTLKSFNDLKKIHTPLSLLIISFAIISIYVAIFGEYTLPKILRPIDYINDRGIPIIKGMFYTATALFSTPTQLGFFGLIIFVLAMSILSKNEKKQNIYVLITLISSFIVLYLSGRRIMTYYAILIAIYVFFKKKNFIFKILLIVFLIILSLLWIDNNTELLSKRGEKRLSYLLKTDYPNEKIFDTIQNRIEKYALYYTFNHLHQAPLGTYLGNYGPVSRAFSINKTQWTDEGIAIESGSTLLAAEMGWIGFILMPIILIYIIYQLYYHSNHSQNRNIIRTLILFFILFIFNFFTKGYTVVMSNQVQALFFWSVPGICVMLIEEPISTSKINKNIFNMKIIKL